MCHISTYKYGSCYSRFIIFSQMFSGENSFVRLFHERQTPHSNRYLKICCIFEVLFRAVLEILMVVVIVSTWVIISADPGGARKEYHMQLKMTKRSNSSTRTMGTFCSPVLNGSPVTTTFSISRNAMNSMSEIPRLSKYRIAKWCHSGILLTKLILGKKTPPKK